MTASPLLRTATDFPTDYWNDSCNEAELRYAIENGAVGATTNPTIVGAVMVSIPHLVWTSACFIACTPRITSCAENDLT